jgi:ribosomal protein S18 acetylase RimI-like enzyme
VIIRPAEEEDVDSLLLIEQTCFSHERFPRHYIEGLMALRAADVLVGTVRELVVSSAMVMHYDARNRSHLLSLATLPSHQGRGLSRKMLARAEELARRHGSSSMSLEVRKGNSPAIHLYERQGYSTVGALADFFGPREDAWQMEKPLWPGASILHKCTRS